MLLLLLLLLIVIITDLMCHDVLVIFIYLKCYTKCTVQENRREQNSISI